MDKKLIVFDFFGVFCYDVADKWMEKHFPEEKRAIFRREFFPKVDSGFYTKEECFGILERESGMPADDIFEEWVAEANVNYGTIEVVRDIKKKYPDITVVLLSNANVEHIEAIFERYNMKDLFDVTFISGNIKMCKPDPNFFRYALESTGFRGEEAIMIDDRQQNLNAAESVGMSGILFESAEQLRKALDL